MALLLGASKLAQGGAFGVAPVTLSFLKSIRGLASTTTGASAAAQPLTAEEAAPEPAAAQQAHSNAAPRWKSELGVIRTDWT